MEGKDRKIIRARGQESLLGYCVSQNDREAALMIPQKKKKPKQVVNNDILTLKGENFMGLVLVRVSIVLTKKMTRYSVFSFILFFCDRVSL